MDGGQTSIAAGPAFARMGEENAFAVLARAAELTARGRDVINLGIGQPDFPTPPHIVEAAVKALRDGAHGYTPATGISPLRKPSRTISARGTGCPARRGSIRDRSSSCRAAR